ncbi:1,5-anhydro-D-fructose reductase-like [Ctenocephalides felis]|uniref:1,5-anhydro-D-fructose reductase-like n=1 Tax=Ctenocephalides felis TaxID=7515 RepID=UPI000E6E3B01|nr:1,5-anhydro-D-fructose reductase-like [Ctenocephalides felis]
MTNTSEIVKYAIDVGYRHFDTAYVYQNEDEVGQGIKSKIKEGKVKREELYITSKLWNTFHRPDLVRTSLLESLENLQLDYVDLYLMHWPMAFKEGKKLRPIVGKKVQFSDVDYLDTWNEMENLYHNGLASNIGVSNFNSNQLKRLLKNCNIKPVTNQVELNPYINQKCLQRFCKGLNIITTAYSPLGSPARISNNHGMLQHTTKLLQNKWLIERAKELEKSPAQICLRWSLQCGNIVIPKSSNKEHVATNFKVFDFELCPEDMEKIDNLNRNERIFTME